MNQSKWIVESPTHLRMLPETPEPKDENFSLFDFGGTMAYGVARTIWKEKLASQPTIKRGDNGQWSIGDVKIENVDFDVKYESPDGGFVFDYSDAKEHQQFELFTPIALPKKKQQESEESEFELLLQLQSAFRDIEKLSFKEAMKAKEELLTRYSIKRK